MQTEKRTNLVLIGMPASGKSTVGVILAKLMGMDFIDTDLLIQKQAGRRLSEIIEEQGLQGFLDLESRVCGAVAAENSVIATGGSVVYGDAAMTHLRSIGRVIYLDVSYENLMKRLHNVRQRGVVLREGQTVESLYAERAPLYQKYADLTVREADGGIEDTVAGILKLLDAAAVCEDNAT